MQRKKRSLKGLRLMMSLRQKMGLKLMMSLKQKMGLTLMMCLGLHNRPMRDR